MELQTVAAIQTQCRTADLDYNLAHVKELALEAVHKGAKVISLPEFFTTTIVMDDRLRGCALPPQNVAIDLLLEIASDKQVLIGGSYLEERGDDVFNCYTLVRPDGTVTRHDKDLPTMIENAYYIGGQTEGIHETNYGRVGTAMCWELIRTQTLNRLKGEIDFVMSGTHWWTSPSNWSFLNNVWDKADKNNREMFTTVPQVFARSLGVANIHASHCGQVEGQYPMLPRELWNLDYKTHLLGGTQVIDNKGNILAHLGADDGPGVLTADIDLSSSEASLAIPERFWIPEMPFISKMTWWHQNFVSKGIYKRARKTRNL